MGFIDGETYTLDRFEGEFAILIDKEANPLVIELEQLPANAAEGDFLLLENGDFRVDYGLTSAKRDRIKSRFDRLKKKK